MLHLMTVAAESAEEVVYLLDAEMVAMMVGLVIPLLVGILTKVGAPGGLRAVLNLLLSGLGGVLALYTQGIAQADAGDFLFAVISTWIVSILSYYGLWKPTGVAGTVIDATGRFGVGPKPTMETDEKGIEGVRDQRPPA